MPAHPKILRRLLTPDPTVLQSSYDYWLVALSVVLAMFAAFAALELAGRVTAAHHRKRAAWLAIGSMAMGMGIWSMHYVGMLAFRLPVPVSYHYPTVLASLLVAIAASAVALFTVSRERMEMQQQIVGSLLMGGGIAGMHYIGMYAMRLPAMMEYRWGIVLLSVVLAVVISFVALVLAFGVRHEQQTSARKILSAIVMGSAIPLMHYAGMWAVRFHAASASLDTTEDVRIPPLGIAIISITSLSVLAVAIASAFLDRFLRAQQSVTNAAREGEMYFRTLAEAVPGMIWTATADGASDFFNDSWYQYTGLTFAQSAGWGWKTALHPDDAETAEEEWKKASVKGESYEIEYRFLRCADQTYRWFLGRANPVRNEKGEIVKWFGTCTDIEDQKHHLQILEEQIKERTLELADTNTKLQEEMWERDSARRELDFQNERMVSELTQRSQRATLLAKMGEHLQSCITKEEVFAAALGYAPKIFPTRRGCIALFNSGRDLVEVTGSWADCQLSSMVFEPVSCWALRTGQPHLVPEADNTARCAHVADVKHSYLCVPILAQGESLGILHIQATDEHPTLSDSELSFKTTFAGQVGLSIANIRLREALRSQSIKDPLTGLYNRRYLEEILDREIRRAARAEQALSILVLDLDHFKNFNDTYGHDTGDAVLRETAALVMKSVRIEDVVCRFGGEEFVVVLPTADSSAARGRGERIRERMKELTVFHQGRSVGRITVSIGVATLPIHGTTPKELFESADAALYRAKREGRDRVVTAEPRAEIEALAAAVSTEPGIADMTSS